MIVDTAAVHAQWPGRVAEHLAPTLGGDPAAWAAAHAWAMERRWARLRSPGGTPREVERTFLRLWMREMCERVGVPVPRNSAVLAEETIRTVAARIAAPIDGAVDALRALRARGSDLYTASGMPSPEIEGYLDAIGVRELFTQVYGRDVVDRWKANSGFYRRLLELSGADPSTAVAVDDEEKCLGWAKRAGFATTAFVGDGPSTAEIRIARLADLPAALAAAPPP